MLSVGSALLAYHYYQDHKASTAAQLTVANDQGVYSSPTVDIEQLIQTVESPSDQENIHDPEGGFDQNIDNMFKVAKPESTTKSAMPNSPLASAFGVQAQKPFIQVNDKIKSLKSQPKTIQPSAAPSKEIKQSEKNPVNVSPVTQPTKPKQLEKTIELKTASTSIQEQSPAKTPKENPEVAQS
ncbi:hypothetical protein M1L59_06395 [Acinetobacter schindleri]|uniref:hypothetical protein n=1 Tax=Acinetobacter schindleri TaxID=108981 RepID=UPI00200B83D8|nr:hypothetical protein [Acinetobacter schindleri]